MILVAWSRHDITVLPPLEHRRDIQKLGVFQFLNAIFFLHGVSLAGGFVASVTQLHRVVRLGEPAAAEELVRQGFDDCSRFLRRNGHV